MVRFPFVDVEDPPFFPALRVVVVFCTRVADAFDGKDATGYVNGAIFGHITDDCHALWVWERGPGGIFVRVLVDLVGGDHGTFSGTSGTSPQK